MPNILLTLSYDGTDFCGWQRQDHSDKGNSVRTVQECLETALEKMLRTKIAVQGSGRTDSGVHAKAQAVNFTSPFSNIPEENYVRALNGLLPKDIRISSAKEMPDDFSSRFSATSRVYHYFIKCGKFPEARDSRYVWYIPQKPSAECLNRMCKCLKGEMDCATFAAAGDMSVSTKRYLEKASWWYEKDSDGEENILVFEIEANAFLWKMVRSITGTLIQLEYEMKKKGASDEDCAEEFKRRVLSCKRSEAGVTAPPDGLFLWEVKFDGIRRHV